MSHDSDRDELSLHDLLTQCATNLTERAREGALHTVYGRDEEVEQVLTSLASPLKGRILVTGEARVGKTAVIQGAASRMLAGDCPESIVGSQVWGLSPRTILRAFGVRGWQEGLGLLMEKWGSHPEIILYVDALPTMMLAGATMEDPFDMAQFLLGQFQNSNSRILAEGRTHQIHSFLDTYPEYRHVLLEVRITEPDIDDAMHIVRAAVTDLAEEAVHVEPEAINVAVDVTRRFALQESLPGKAIDLIEEAIALRHTEESAPVVTAEDIIQRFTDNTGLPRMLLTDDEPFDEELVQRHFNDQVLGQDQAVDVIVQALSLLRTRLNNPRRPMGVFLFIGPTGVGKTELARVLARFLFGGDDVIVRFNMADYTQDWHTRTLFGDPHGYSLEARRGQFTTRLQDKAFAVILLDEFEKAHPEIYQRFLQLFDEGVHINGASEVINLRNSIVILTSNFGAQTLEAQRIGFGPSTTLEEQERQIREEIVRFFSPEFINRIDNVCFFKPLTKPILREIAYRRVREILQREGVTRRGLQVEIEDEVIEWVVEHGYSERYGARYLARQIEKTITYPLARQVIRNEPPEQSTVRLFLHNDRVASALTIRENPNRTADDESALVDPDNLPRSLTLPLMNAGLPLIEARVAHMEADSDLAATRTELTDLMRRMSLMQFWDDPRSLQQELQKMARLAYSVERIDSLRRNVDELRQLLQQASQTDQLDALTDAANRYRYIVNELARADFAHPWASLSAWCIVTPIGRRDTAQQWARDLAAMLQTHAGQAVVVGEDWRRDGLGLILRLDGPDLYGRLRHETGRHRLIQTTPAGRTQYIQAQVEVIPQIKPATTSQAINVRWQSHQCTLTIEGQEVFRVETTLSHQAAVDQLTQLAHMRHQMPDPTTDIVRDYDRRTGHVTDYRLPDHHFDLAQVLAGSTALHSMLHDQQEGHTT